MERDPSERNGVCFLSGRFEDPGSGGRKGIRAFFLIGGSFVIDQGRTKTFHCRFLLTLTLSNLEDVTEHKAQEELFALLPLEKTRNENQIQTSMFPVRFFSRVPVCWDASFCGDRFSLVQSFAMARGSERCFLNGMQSLKTILSCGTHNLAFARWIDSGPKGRHFPEVELGALIPTRERVSFSSL
jgi:hypothetical protein